MCIKLNRYSNCLIALVFMRLSVRYFELFGLTIEHYEKFIFSNLVSNYFKSLQII